MARGLLESLPDALDIVICEGWLARAFALNRRWNEASAVAAKLAERIVGGKRPAVGQCVDGFAGWAETVLADWQRVPDSPAAARQALRACTELRRFARIFRMAQPAALRCSAQALWLGGHPGRALRRWKKSVHSAGALQMPYEEVRAYAALARVSDAADAARYRAAAQRALDGLGCSGLSVESL